MSNIQQAQEQFSLTPKTFGEALKYAELIANSDLAPKDYKGKPGNVMVALQMGAELGLKPLQALQNIAVINGRPCVWGDAMLAIVRAHHEFEDIIEKEEGGTAYCIVKRKGQSPVERKFSDADAKAAGLLNKQGPWSQYPARMKQMRARAFALRDAFADALKGLSSAEEVSDYKVEKDITPPLSRASAAINALVSSKSEPVKSSVETAVDEPYAPHNENGHTKEQLSQLTDTLLNVIKNAKTLDNLSGIREASEPLSDAMRQTVVSACNAKVKKLKECEPASAIDDDMGWSDFVNEKDGG